MKQQENNKMKTASTLAAILVASSISFNALAEEPAIELMTVNANGMTLLQPALIDWSDKVQTRLDHKMDTHLDHELLAFNQTENGQVINAEYNITGESEETVSFQFSATAVPSDSAVHVTVIIN